MTDKEEKNTTPTPEIKPAEAKKTFKVKVPDVKDLLKAGIQFGHETKRWNPKMSRFIYGERNKIHIVDVTKTRDYLEKAANFLAEAASSGPVMFVGTKRQASGITREEAIRCGAYFIDKRWAGGSLTNFNMIKKSINKLNKLEEEFEEGVEGRTKYEVSLMKKEWMRLDRLYSGIKLMKDKPTAIVVLDVKYEKNVVHEALAIGLPIVGVVDTNCDPDNINYIIPGNDDAIGSIQLILSTLANAVLEGNKGMGVKHKLKDYSKFEVKIKKIEGIEDESTETVKTVVSTPKATETKEQLPEARKGRSTRQSGLLNKGKSGTRSTSSAKKTKAKTSK